MGRWLFAVLVLAALLIRGVALLPAITVRIPARLRLAQSRGEQVRVAFVCPRGERYRLLPGVPKAKEHLPFAGPETTEAWVYVSSNRLIL